MKSTVRTKLLHNGYLRRLNELPLKKDIRLRKILNQLGPFVWLDSEDLIKVKRVEIFKALSNLLQLVKRLIKIVTFLYLA